MKSLTKILLELYNFNFKDIDLNVSKFGNNIENIDVFFKGNKIGYVQLLISHKNKSMTIGAVETTTKGFGKSIYVLLQKRYPTYSLTSDKTSLSNSAINLWDSFVRRGLAIKRGDKDYILTL